MLRNKYTSRRQFYSIVGTLITASSFTRSTTFAYSCVIFTDVCPKSLLTV